MFDIGWGELFLIGVVALIVVGPKELPGLFRTVGNFTGKARMMARDFQRSLEQAANEAGMSDMQKSLRSLDQTLNSATDSARKFATQPVRSVVKETVMKAVDAGEGEGNREIGPEAATRPAAEAPVADAPVADAPGGEAVATAEAEERAAGR